MGKLNHSRDMSFRHGFVSDNSLQSMRDDLAHRDGGYQKAGKTIHVHTPIREAPREFTADELFATRIQEARKGNPQFQFLVGKEYAERGNLIRAKRFLEKAASKGWPGAAVELTKLKAVCNDESSAGGKTIFKDRKKPSTCKAKVTALPELAYFRVQYSNTFAKVCKAPWIILVSCKNDGKGLRLASDVGQEFNMVIKESFKTRPEAIMAGKEYISKWGK